MKKTVLLFLTVTTLSFSESVAQDVKTKKDVVYIDKEAVANYSGKAGAFKGVDLSFRTLDDKPLFNLKQVYVRQNHPSLENKVWTEVIISGTVKKYRYLMDKPFFNESKILDDLLTRTSIDLFKGDFSTLEAIDESDDIIADSIRTSEFKSDISTALKEGHRNREEADLIFKNKPVEQIVIREEKTSTVYKLMNRFDVYQGGEFLGYITREEQQFNANSNMVRYRVYKNLNREFQIGDDTLKEVLAAQADFPAISSRIATFQDFKEHSMTYDDEPKDPRHAERDLIRFLVKKGFL